MQLHGAVDHLVNHDVFDVERKLFLLWIYSIV